MPLPDALWYLIKRGRLEQSGPEKIPKTYLAGKGWKKVCL